MLAAVGPAWAVSPSAVLPVQLAAVEKDFQTVRLPAAPWPAEPTKKSRSCSTVTRPRLYNRELRKNPTLRGQIVIKLTIEPDGSVSFCALQSSDMEAPTLADQVVQRVGTFDFGAKEDIAAVTIIYPIDFLPAA